jgi:glycerol uptake facilitator-like aquaporin
VRRRVVFRAVGGRFDPDKAVSYIVVQCVAGVAAAFVFYLVL